MIHLVLCWHFHQPDYRGEDGEYFLPWTYLHALKDYADMVAHLEAAPAMRLVINLVPSLLEQLDDYAAQFRSRTFRDPLLRQLDRPGGLDREARRRMGRACFHLNPATMLDPFPGYRRLRDIWEAAGVDRDAAALDDLSDAYLADLLTWYHLAWTGETLRRAHPWLLELLARERGFSPDERQRLLALIGDTLAGLPGRLRALAERGQVELAATPYSHPLAPLLLDFRSALDARPGLALPARPGYPGGGARVRAQIVAAQEAHMARFGRPPAGFWPAEGAISRDTVACFDQVGARWLASGEAVLRHSLAVETALPGPGPCRPYRLPGLAPALFFRDDRLSDLIGFEYKSWLAEDAVRHFVHSLTERYRGVAAAQPVVSIVLDGENPWDYYPYNGWYFIHQLYAALSRHPEIRVTTFGDYLDEHPEAVGTLPRLSAGSWVYGDFTTWIGEPAKNRAWELLCDAKAAYDQALDGLPESARAVASRLLRDCESSDWFWWFGDYNPGHSVRQFDQLFRSKLASLYRALRLELPPELARPLSAGGDAAREAGGVMRRGG